MGLESTNARMNHLGRYELFNGSVIDADELVAAYDAVTADQICTLANEVFRFDQASICTVGKPGQRPTTAACSREQKNLDFQIKNS